MQDGAILDRETLGAAARVAFELAARRRWRSYDPYDLLLAPAGRRVQAASWFAARVVVQAGKHSGSRTRRALGVPEHEEPQALADFLRAATMLAARGESWAWRYVDELGVRLRALAVPVPEGLGWSLGFPYASRFVNVGARTPNIYTTTAASRALLDLYGLTGDLAARRAAFEGIRFVLDGLGTFEHGGHRWHRYFRGTNTPTVNVQATFAALLAQAARTGNDQTLANVADDAVEAVLASQRQDGSWAYSDDGRASFVDGFHTGFTLEGLADYATSRGAPAAERSAEALTAGYRYFRRHLMTADAVPRGFADGKPSLDGQNVAQCIQTLLVCGGDAQARGDASRLWRLTVSKMLASNRAPSFRWVLAPAVSATAYLHRAAAA